MSEPVCRVCLGSNIQMQCIDSIELQEFYEKLISSKLNTDGLPNTLCLICLPQLEHMLRFMKIARQSNQILRELWDTGIQITERTINERLSSLNPANSWCSNDSSIVIPLIKIEPEVTITIKEEIQDTEQELIEVKIEPSYPESCCSVCKKIFYSSDNETKICDDCLEARSSMYQLQQMSSEQKTLIKCDECSESFVDENTLTKHYNQTHNDDRPFVCNTCHKRFIKSGHLLTHTRTHTGEKPFACNRCDKTFTAKYVLTSHMRIHTGEKPYPCDQCDMAFRQKCVLSRHVKAKHSHENKRPHVCTICNKRFVEKGQLQIHLQIHMGDKLYICNECDMSFKQRCVLLRHIKAVHTAERPYACKSCRKTFYRKGQLTLHLLRIHQIKKLDMSYPAHSSMPNVNSLDTESELNTPTS